MPTILIAEDDPDQRELVQELLAENGYTVLEAEDGPGAVAAARAARPDLVLMDMMMPRIDDGLTATRELKADPATAGIPVIGLSGRAMYDERERARDAGCADLVKKPFDFDHLLAAIRKHLPGDAR